MFAGILPLGALVIALYIKNAYSILMFAWSFYAAAAGLPAFAALYWKKATKAGIIAGMVAGFTVCVGWKLAGVPAPLPALLHWLESVWLPIGRHRPPSWTLIRTRRAAEWLMPV